MNRSRLVLLLWCATVLAAPPLMAADASKPTDQFAQTRDHLYTKAATSPLSVEEHFNLTASLLGLGQFQESTVVAKLGLGLTQNRIEKSLFYMAIAQCHGARGLYGDAGEAALEGQRLDPLSKDLAALRFAYFTKHGDQAQAKAAEDTLRQLVPGLGERPIALGPLGPMIVGFLMDELKEQGKILFKIVMEEWEGIKKEAEVIARRMGEKWVLAQADRLGPKK